MLMLATVLMSIKQEEKWGSGCGSVGIAVVSNTRDQWFESTHWQILFTINYYCKDKIEGKEAGMAHFFKKNKTKTKLHRRS